MIFKGSFAFAAAMVGLSTLPAHAFTIESGPAETRQTAQFGTPNQVYDAQTRTDAASSGTTYSGFGRERIPVDDRGLPYGVAPPRDLSHQYWGSPLLEAPYQSVR